MLSPTLLLVGLIALLALRRIHYELTTGARRRRMIRDNRCEPPVRFEHRGVLGRWLGIDVIKEVMRTAKEGTLHEHSRARNFTGRNTLELRMLLSTVVFTIEPENVKAVLSTKFEDFQLGPRRVRTFVPVLGHGIFDTDGKAWERSRALIRPNFTRHQVADLDTFETHVSHLINTVPKDGATVDLQDLFFSLTMDSATEFLFGQSTNILAPGLETKKAQEFVKAFVYVTHAMAGEFQSGGLSRWIPDKKWRDGVKVIHKFADDIVAETLRLHNNNDLEKHGSLSSPTSGVKKERYVFLHQLVKQTQDPYTLRSELLNVLLAGRDTTAGLLSNTWHVLARRPDIWAKLRVEVDALGGEKPDYTQIKDMRYLRYVLNESLRLMPVVPGNNRTAIRDTILPLGGGKDGKSPLFVPKGRVIGYSPWSMHRRADFYGDDVLEFKPERWEKLRPGWEYLPFNGGPRICIGQQFALLEASYTTIRLMQRFPKIEARDGREWREFLTLTLASGTGCLVGLFEK
jgi:cytochrome P450